MATSANRVEYTIFDKDGKEVGRHSQNILCKRCNDGLDKFVPAEEFTILSWGYDEEEELWFGEVKNLAEWLKKNPAEFTHHRFEVGDLVKLTKRRGFAKVLELGKKSFFQEYLVELESGDQITIHQGEIIPVNNR